MQSDNKELQNDHKEINKKLQRDVKQLRDAKRLQRDAKWPQRHAKRQQWDSKRPQRDAKRLRRNAEWPQIDAEHLQRVAKQLQRDAKQLLRDAKQQWRRTNKKRCKVTTEMQNKSAVTQKQPQRQKFRTLLLRFSCICSLQVLQSYGIEILMEVQPLKVASHLEWRPGWDNQEAGFGTRMINGSVCICGFPSFLPMWLYLFRSQPHPVLVWASYFHVSSDCVRSTGLFLCPECIPLLSTHDWPVVEGDDLMHSADIEDVHRRMLFEVARDVRAPGVCE